MSSSEMSVLVKEAERAWSTGEMVEVERSVEIEEEGASFLGKSCWRRLVAWYVLAEKGQRSSFIVNLRSRQTRREKLTKDQRWDCLQVDYATGRWTRRDPRRRPCRVGAHAEGCPARAPTRGAPASRRRLVPGIEGGPLHPNPSERWRRWKGRWRRRKRSSKTRRSC